VAEQRNSSVTASDREIVISRVRNAQRALVFDVWTDPNHVGKWYGPRGFTITTHTMDVRPGGAWNFVMHGPDGVNYQNKIVFIEVVRPECLVYSHGGEEGEPGKFHVTLTFEDHNGKTLLTMRSLFESAAARNWVVTEHHAIEGGNQTLDRLQEHLATMDRKRRRPHASSGYDRCRRAS
jgi:uncharacterized protein YndB with AHSA1/START domain